MAISADYPSPVTVNGFSCRNCTEVDEARKFIDPQHPKDGPFGINAKDHKTAAAKDTSDRSPAVVFGGQLAALRATGQVSTASGASPSAQPATQNSNASIGARLDVSA